MIWRVLALLLIASPAFASMQVWVDHGAVKVKQQGSAIGSAQDISLTSAKNEFEPFQIFIYANGETLTGVDVAVSDLTNGANTISSNVTEGVHSDVRIYKQEYMTISQTLRSDYQLGIWPDPLLPKKDVYYNEVRTTFPFSVTSGNVQGVWIDIGVPAATAAGTYTGTYTVTADGKAPVTGNITLQVRNFALPSTATLKTHWGVEDSYLSTGWVGYTPTSVATVAVNAGGTGYQVGDTIRIHGTSDTGVNPLFYASTAYATVTSVGTNNAVTGIEVLHNGISYGNRTAAVTTQGSGTGLRVDITIYGYSTFGGSEPAYTTWVAQRLNLLQKSYLYHRLSLNAKGGSAAWFTTINKTTPNFAKFGNYSTGEVAFSANWTTAYASMLDGTAITAGAYAGAKKSAQLIEMGHATGTAYDSSHTEWKNVLKSWWDYFTAQGWEPKKKLFVYSTDETRGYTVSYRTQSVTDHYIHWLKAKSMYDVDTGGAGTWTNTLANKSKDTLDPKIVSSLINPTPSFDDIGTWCPVSIRYEWGTNRFNGADYQVMRNTYGDYSSWPTRDHWWYFADNVTSVNIPNMDMSTEAQAIWTRAIPWLSWTYRNTGLLYYDANITWRGVYRPFVNTYQQQTNGQDTQVYPGVAVKTAYHPASTPEIGGTNDIPVESIKLKLLREGQEDFEYMELLRQAGKLAEADALVDTIYLGTPYTDGHGKYFSASTDTGRYFAAREAMAALITGEPAPPPATGKRSVPKRMNGKLH